MAKRKLNKELVLAEVEKEDTNLTIHAHVIEVSPLKLSQGTKKPYFTAKLGDGNKTCRMICFEDECKQKEFEKFKMEQKVAKITDMVAEKNEFSKQELQLKVIHSSEVFESDWKIQKPTCKDVPTWKINEIKEKDDCETTDFGMVIKVLKTMGVRKVESKNGKKMNREELTVCDETGTIKLILWHGNTGVLTVGNSYSITHLYTQKYRGDLYLYMSEFSNIENTSAANIKIKMSGEITHAGVVKNIVCVSCNDKVKATGQLYYCATCKMKMKKTGVKTFLGASLKIRTSDGNEEEFEIDEAKIKNLIDTNPSTMSAGDIEDALLSIDKYEE